MYQLRNRNILIISPQPWGIMHVSKHHYAIELSKNGNNIYFLNPPDNHCKEVIIQPEKIYPNLHIISYKPIFPFSIRFKSRWLYDLLMHKQIKIIRKRLPNIDVTWCFDQNIFSDLRLFGASLNIYHPVDPVVYPYQYKPALSANVVLSVSEKILSGFFKYNAHCFHINHGINQEFERFAIKNLETLKPFMEEKIKVGYVGNLLRGIIDHELVITIINDNPQVEFHFWGPSEINGNNLSGDTLADQIQQFINFLKAQNNVYLHGSKQSKELISEISEMDAFILFYREKKNESDRSNAHKLLEYFATGKVVICNLISNYSNYLDIIQMPEDDDDNKLPMIFKKTMEEIKYHNSPEKQRVRLELAIKNTYANHILEIESKLP